MKLLGKIIIGGVILNEIRGVIFVAVGIYTGSVQKAFCVASQGLFFC